MSFIARHAYTYEELVFVKEAFTVQQNDSDRTRNTDSKIIKKIEQVNGIGIALYKFTILSTGLSSRDTTMEFLPL